jgi:glucosamine--fructose-6-phosphate aminotransferase (isomerizing)
MAYRGYDSAGVLTNHDGRFHRNRAKGKIENLIAVNHNNPLPGRTAIGHTRWATHGSATEGNAHPHICGSVSVVHNGIIENHAELREEARISGLEGTSQTDTEVIALLIETYRRKGKTPVEAFRSAVDRLDGAYAICAVFTDDAETIHVARKGSPLAIGLGGTRSFVGSDAVSLAPLTQSVCYLEEGDTAIVSPVSTFIFDNQNTPVARDIHHLEEADSVAEKEGHAHFMSKEMHEQPRSVARTIAGQLDQKSGDFTGALLDVDFSKTRRILMIACGTSYFSCLTAKYWFESLSGISADIDVASEAQYRNLSLNADDAVIFVSQSGETADTLAALKHIKPKGPRIISLVNTVESSIARESHVVLPLRAGPEIGVASTKAFTCQLALLALIAIKAGRDTGFLKDGTFQNHLNDLGDLPQLLSDTLSVEESIIAIARDIAPAASAFFIGRGTSYPIAMEGALKLKEISYIHSEGYAAGELKHGPIALIDTLTPTVALFSGNSEMHQKTLSNAQEVSARGGPVYLLSDGPVSEQGIKRTALLPQGSELTTPFIQAVAVQILSYHTALILDRDIDQPRNLAKSVTVS